MFGYSLAGSGDVNSDGFDDLAIGSPYLPGSLGNMQGRVDIFLGSATGPGSMSSWGEVGSVAKGMFGYAVSRAGNVNGDQGGSYDDLIVGQPGIIITDPSADGSEGMTFLFMGADAPGGICHPNGIECSDGEFCTIDDSCLSGICVAGGARDCSAMDNECTEGICDEVQDACVPDFLTGACEDGLYCTVGEYCKAGDCVNGVNRDCSHLDDECNHGVCDEEDNDCKNELISTSCDDESPFLHRERHMLGRCLRRHGQDRRHRLRPGPRRDPERRRWRRHPGRRAAMHRRCPDRMFGQLPQRLQPGTIPDSIRSK